MNAYSQHRRVLIMAPVHRSWGNRVMREAVALAEHGYCVEAWLSSEEETTRHGIHIKHIPVQKTRLKRVLANAWLGIRAAREKPDIYHLHNPDMLPIAIALKLLGRRVIYDTHEDYLRRLMMRHWIPRLLRRPLCVLVAALEWVVSKMVDSTLVTQEHLVTRYGRNTVLLRNAPSVPKALVDEVERRGAVQHDGIHHIIYAGKISVERGFVTMLDALAQANKAVTVRLWLAGTDPYGVLAGFREHPGWKYVDYLGLLSQEDVFAYVSASDLGLVVISDIGDHATAKPSKLFEYMAFGTPFIASDFPAWRQFIEPAEAGWWVSPDDARKLAETIIECLKNPSEIMRRGLEGRRFIDSFNWSNESRVLIDVYERLTARHY